MLKSWKYTLIKLLGTTLPTSNLVSCIASSKTCRRTQPEPSSPSRLYCHHEVLKDVYLCDLSTFRLGTRCDYCWHLPTSCTEWSVHRLQARGQHNNDNECCMLLQHDFVLFGAWFRSWWIPCNLLQRCGTEQGHQKVFVSPDIFWIESKHFQAQHLRSTCMMASFRREKVFHRPLKPRRSPIGCGKSLPGS